MRDPTNEAFGNVNTSVPAAGDDAALTSSGPRETTASPYATRWISGSSLAATPCLSGGWSARSMSVVVANPTKGSCKADRCAYLGGGGGGVVVVDGGGVCVCGG